MKKFMQNNPTLMVAILTITGGLMLFYGVYLMHSIECQLKYDVQLEPQYGFFTGCTVRYKGIRIPAQNFRVGDL